MAISREKSETVTRILSEILSIPTNVHDDIQVELTKILERHGLVAAPEHLLPRYLSDSNRAGYLDVASTGPIRIGIEVDHSVPRHRSILKLNYFNGDISIVVLKGKRVGWDYKSEETVRRCQKLKTDYVVVNLTDKKIMLSSPGFSLA